MTTKHRTYTLHQIKTANAAAGHHWFDPDTLHFFGSRVAGATYGPDSRGHVYFVSSERSGFDQDSPRRYTVRVFDPATGSVDTFGTKKDYGMIAEVLRAQARKAA